MFLVIAPDQFHIDFVLFSPPLKNNIISNGLFTRILYSTDCVGLYGVYIHIMSNSVALNPMSSTLHILPNATGDALAAFLIALENQILDKYVQLHWPKSITYKLSLHATDRTLKLSNPTQTPLSATSVFCLKITGVWESETQCGLTYTVFIK